MRRAAISSVCFASFVLALILSVVLYSHAGPSRIGYSPRVLTSGGDTAWVKVHVDGSYCPGDPYGGHGGEATGGPGPAETWCFEANWPYGDSCGTAPPWDVNCFSHVDVKDTIIDQWHMVHDSDPPFEGGDGGYVYTCWLDSSVAFRARPEGGYPVGVTWRNGWHYRLLSPVVPIPPGPGGQGCVVQYDEYVCTTDITCDVVDTRVRAHQAASGAWGDWVNIDGQTRHGGCDASDGGVWEIDVTEDISKFYDAGSDSLQFGWDIADTSQPGDLCRSKHRGTDYQIDNVSIGFYEGGVTLFTARRLDLLHDTFNDSVSGYNTFFDACSLEVVQYYSQNPQPPLPDWQNLNVDVVDKDGLRSVTLWGSVDEGATWQSKPLILGQPFDPGRPWLGGLYYETWDHTEFGFPLAWPRGTEIWYHVLAEDSLYNLEYFPASADPGSPEHIGGRNDYLSFTVLPQYPPEFTGPRLLLVDAYGEGAIDWSPCLESAGGGRTGLRGIYERVLVDAGYCFDTYDIHGAGTGFAIQCPDFSAYDCVVWFTGPEAEENLFSTRGVIAINIYFDGGGKVVMAGDRISYYLSQYGCMPYPCDPEVYLLINTLGCDYLEEMAAADVKPFIYLEGADTLQVFGMPTPIDLGSLLVYRACPDVFRGMSWVKAKSSSYPGYTAQPLLEVLNPDVSVAHGAIYAESPAGGQAVFINSGLSSFISHETQYCDGLTPDPVPDFDPGVYEGRVDLVRVILEDIMGLPSAGSGAGGTAETPADAIYAWRLARNAPNPFSAATEIRYVVQSRRKVTINVYDTMGRLVRTLVDTDTAPGIHSTCWDGRDSRGRRASGGIYFCKMEAGDFTASRKMILAR
ncbi:MAG: FlgD immunoglobulin-like domain containing protein [bacterium]|jgi:hypothetical protein